MMSTSKCAIHLYLFYIELHRRLQSLFSSINLSTVGSKLNFPTLSGCDWVGGFPATYKYAYVRQARHAFLRTFSYEYD